MRQGQLDQALRVFREMTSLDNTNAMGWLGMGRCCSRKQELEAACSHLSAARKHLSAKIEVSPQASRLRVLRAQCLRELALSQPSSTLPPSPIPPTAKDGDLSRQSLLAQAASDLDLVLSTEASFVDALIERSLVRLALGLIDQGRSDLEVALLNIPQRMSTTNLHSHSLSLSLSLSRVRYTCC